MATRKYRKWTLEEKEAILGPRPKCCNPGCGEPAYGNGHRWTQFCSSCREVSQGKKPPKPGITYLRKHVCGNYDGRYNLGFPCPLNWDFVKKHNFKIITEMDHIDGNHLNNDPNNIQELCSFCHDRKSAEGKDKDGWKKRREMKGREAIDLQVLFTA